MLLQELLNLSENKSAISVNSIADKADAAIGKTWLYDLEPYEDAHPDEIQYMIDDSGFRDFLKSEFEDNFDEVIEFIDDNESEVKQAIANKIKNRLSN